MTEGNEATANKPPTVTSACRRYYPGGRRRRLSFVVRQDSYSFVDIRRWFARRNARRSNKATFRCHLRACALPTCCWPIKRPQSSPRLDGVVRGVGPSSVGVARRAVGS
ncbi:hypothetical protein LSAT2_027748 [Lamellibrachia satsuma]|nr:hypothetical protein LSAT2_027748 [Lamellibrachia satsuma]